MTTLSITTNEWFAARDTVLAAAPAETDANGGVAMITQNGERWWTAWTDDMVATSVSFPDAGELDQVTLVSPRIVVAAARMSADLDGDVTLQLGDDRATLSTPDLMMTVAAPEPRSVPVHLPAVDSMARGDVRAADLHRLLDIAGVLPAGVDPMQAMLPPFLLQIWESGIGAWVDWSTADVPATRFDVAAHTVGEGLVHVSPSLLMQVIAQSEPTDEVAVSITEDLQQVVLEGPTLTARVRAAAPDGAGVGDDDMQLQLFDPDELVDPGFQDPFEGWSLSDIRALTMDPDPDVRMRATASRWNWDLRVQEAFASDPDERVVLALLDHVDPGVEATELIIDGPHVEARRLLAGRNLRSELLMRLSHDDDPITRESAIRTLVSRGIDVAALTPVEHS